jgi:hypothetical protein
LAGREDSFWLAEKKVVFGWQWKKSFASRGERLWLVEENVFGWQRRTFLSGKGGSLWLAVEKVFAVFVYKLATTAWIIISTPMAISLILRRKTRLLKRDFLKVFVSIKAIIAKTPKTMQRKLITQNTK